MTSVLIMNGTGGSGKGTVIEYLKELTELRIHEYSSIDYVKAVAIAGFGWNGVKDVAGRNLLAAIKQAMIAYNDLPTKKVAEQIEWAKLVKVDILVVDIREPNEIEKLVIHCNLQKIQCVTCRVINTAKELEAEKNGLSLTGDRLYGKYDYDVEISNNGTLKQLKDTVSLIFGDVYGGGGPTPDHAIDAIKYALKAQSSSVVTARGEREMEPRLPFSDIDLGCCKVCGGDVGYYALFNCQICDYCGQKYENK